MNSANKSFNSQILDYFKKTKNPEQIDEYNRIKNILTGEMRYLKFGYPVRQIDELNEVIRLCVLYHTLRKEPALITNQFEKNEENYNLSISLTERCGNFCQHCSTNASLENEKKSVQFRSLRTALEEMKPHIRMLYISCEGSPYYYESLVNGEHGIKKKTIVDVIDLILDKGYSKISFQSMVPKDTKYKLLEEILSKIQNSKQEIEFIPQISFNLYALRAGLKLKTLEDQDEQEFSTLYLPNVKWTEFRENFSALLEYSDEENVGKSGIQNQKEGNKLVELYNSSRELLDYLNDLKSMIVAFASKGHQIHFEIRGDPYGNFTNLKALKVMLQAVLEQVSIEQPDLDLSKCDQCSQIHYSQNCAHIVPLGRATKLFPNGKEKEKDFFEKHVLMNEHKYLCDNWTSWGSMIVDTKGFPQLCYSNLALTPKARTVSGPNLYRDGFNSINEFYIRVWRDRMGFLKEKLPEIVKSRPNTYFCPLRLFQKTLTSWN